MSACNVIIRSDLENIIKTPSDQYENDLQQELEELIFVGSEDESENEAPSMLQQEDDNAEDIVIVMDEETAVYADRNYVCLDDIKSQPNSSGKITLYLTEEEQTIINNCNDPKLKQLLLLNRTKAVHIKELCKKLYRLYDEVDKNIKKEKEKFRLEENVKEKKELQSMAKTYIWRIGIPFFKDKSFYSAPPNKDLAIKRENQEFFAKKMVEGRKWTQEDQKILRESVIESYFKHQKLRLEQDIRISKAHIKNISNEMEKAARKIELENLEMKLHELNSTEKEPPSLHCDEGIDWFKIANFDLKARHSYLECKAFWNIYLHPSINKTDWLSEENEKIKELAIKYNYDWDLIAKELNTNRSPYLVCVHYNTKLCDKFKRERFLPEEDEFLLEVVENCRLGDYIPWGRVAYYFEDRSKHQLYHRYRYYLSRKNIRKGTFTEAEDILLTYLTEKFGKDFSRISELIPQRTTVQLRNRYSSYLEKLNIQLGNFTYADDQKILNHVKVNGQKSWGAVARELKRARAHVRQRYLTLMRCMEKYPDSTIESLPRRKQSFLSGCKTKRNARLAICLEKLKKLQGLPTLATVETFLKKMDQDVVKKEKQWRVLKAPLRNPRSVADKEIIELFKGSCRFQSNKKILDERAVMDSARRIIKLFDALGADANLLKEGEVTDDTFILNNDKEILESVKNVLQGNNIKMDLLRDTKSLVLKTVQLNAATIPGPSHSDMLSMDTPKHPVKHLLPPTVNSLLGLRGMIIKYQVYKAANKNLTSIIKPESTKTGPEDPMVWKIQQNLLAHDEYIKAKIEHERDLFYKRFCAVLKWPCIISKKFPEHITKIEEENQEEEEEIIEQQQEKRKIGRPPKRVYDKVLKMVEAKKRKKLDSISADEPKETNAATTSHCNKTTTVSRKTATSNTDASEQPKLKKPKRGRPPNQSKTEHAIAYIPRRSHVKINKPNEKATEQEGEMYVDDPDNISEATANTNETSVDDLPSISTEIHQNENKAPTSLIAQKVINVSEIKLLNSNAVLVDKDKINNLMKLNKLQNAKKIIVFQGPNQKFVGKSTFIPTNKETIKDTSHNQHFTVTESQQEVLDEATLNRAIYQSPSTSTIYENGDEIRTKATKSRKELNTESHQHQPANGTFIIPESEALHVPQFMVTESQQKLLGEAIHQSPSTSTLHQSDQMICINKQQWSKYLQKWKNHNLPEAIKEDLDNIEKEATIIECDKNAVEQNGQILDRNLHTTFDIKIENNAEEESKEEIDSISRELSQELPFEEYKRVIDDNDNCNEELKTVIENNMMKKNTIRLSATIQRIRAKMKQSADSSK